MKSLNEDKSISVAANKDRRFLPNLQHALGDLADSLRPECGPSFHGDKDFGDRKVLALEHGPYLFGAGFMPILPRTRPGGQGPPGTNCGAWQLRNMTRPGLRPGQGPPSQSRIPRIPSH